MENAVKVNSAVENYLREAETTFNLGLEFDGEGHVGCSEAEGGMDYLESCIAEAEERIYR